MDHHEISDGTYGATVATYSDELVTFVVPDCDPSILITREDKLPHTDIVSGAPVRITIADSTITSLEDDY